MEIRNFLNVYTDILKQMEVNEVYGDSKSFPNIPLLNYELTECIFPFLAEHGGEMKDDILVFEGKEFYPFSDNYGKQHTAFLKDVLRDDYENLMNLKLENHTPDELEERLTSLISDINLARQGELNFDTPMSEQEDRRNEMNEMRDLMKHVPMTVKEFKKLFSPYKNKTYPLNADLDDVERAIRTFGAHIKMRENDLYDYSAFTNALYNIQYDAKCDEVPSEYEDRIYANDIELKGEIDALEEALDVNFLATFVDGQEYILPAYLPYEFMEIEGRAVDMNDLPFMKSLEELSQKVNEIAEGITVEYSGSYTTEYHEATWGDCGGEPPYWDEEYFKGTVKLGDYLNSDKLVIEISGMDENPVREKEKVFKGKEDDRAI